MRGGREYSLNSLIEMCINSVFIEAPPAHLGALCCLMAGGCFKMIATDSHSLHFKATLCNYLCRIMFSQNLTVIP